MKLIKTLAPTAVIAVLFCASAGAQESKTEAAPAAKPAAEAPVPATRALRAKLAYCQTCHGLNARGLPYASVPIPRLAGQQPQYIKNQLHNFISKDRTNPIMSNVARVLTPTQVNFLAQQFIKLNPPPVSASHPPAASLVAAGKQIFHNGVPSRNVPPCESCHGADAHGNGEFPRLAGQVPEYVVHKLTNWDKERGLNKANPGAEEIMKPITHELTTQEKREVAAYVSTLR